MTAEQTPFSAFLIGGTQSGCGKTTLTLGLLRAFRRRGWQVAPFKCGPDYIDPILHRQAAGRASFHLDPFFGGAASRFARHAADCRVAVAEGVMGLFDGGASSTGAIAAELRLPVLLAVNARGLSDSIAPLVAGFARWNPAVRVAGVLANNVGSVRHVALLLNALSAAGLPPLLGALPRDAAFCLPERHLGLDTATLSGAWLDHLAEAVEASCDLDRIAALTAMERPAVPRTEPCAVAGKRPWRLGVARDAAFQFYYEENFERLRAAGAELVFFSPLADGGLPERLDALYLGGGYPELFAAELAGNEAMKRAIRLFADTHLVYGECGGYLYMLEQVVDFDGARHAMLGLLPGEAVMNRRLASLGYREAAGVGGRAKGHEFHYSSLAGMTEAPYCWENLRAGAVRGRAMGSYIHVDFEASPEFFTFFCKEAWRCGSRSE